MKDKISLGLSVFTVLPPLLCWESVLADVLVLPPGLPHGYFVSRFLGPDVLHEGKLLDAGVVGQQGMV